MPEKRQSQKRKKKDGSERIHVCVSGETCRTYRDQAIRRTREIEREGETGGSTRVALSDE